MKTPKNKKSDDQYFEVQCNLIKYRLEKIYFRQESKRF